MKATYQYALRLPASLMSALRDIAAEEGISINQFIGTAVAEKLSALRTATYLQERAARADFKKFDRVLKRLGKEAPREEDEMPD